MSYANPRHEGRLVLIQRAHSAFATPHVAIEPNGSVRSGLEGAQDRPIYLLDEVGTEHGKGDIYNLPYLFRKDGAPWFEANSYLVSLVANKVVANRPTDEARRRASKLLDYLIFCETECVDWLDFSGRRPALRPTYRYFAHLLRGGGKVAAVINQYTGVIFDFYRFISANWHPLDMRRVDSVKEVRFLIKTVYGASRVITAEKRSQTKPVAPARLVSIGYLREDGEDLRPLSNSELSELVKIIGGKQWSTLERMILLLALMTGARKQTILTLRMRHLNSFVKDRIQGDGTYLLYAGPGTGIDTKKDRSQRLYVPFQIASELIVLANSPLMSRRRHRFRERLAIEHPDLAMAEEDTYVFLSDQGGCYYMARDDPRYPTVKSPPTGQITDTIKRKLLAIVSDAFPRDFSYHWLRATFGFQLYQRLQVLVEEGKMRQSDVVDFIRERMHHATLEMTEHYLKLFEMLPQKTLVQELFESHLFSSGFYGLILESNNE
ncbi:site-specific integrase [Pseudomonas chlororaphis]|uniref:site-specific integrase n=1 Tax=Pseudomonas chlororaphis TaxID=587753 RepID=UPI000F58CC2E|nr:site-specific integrase [Pseudomonas chlororaphis]AZC84704.1 site-specific recombinase, phage integrase family [Pseudomonas chlororaphis subsp. piscium]